MRLTDGRLNPNDGAGHLDAADERARRAVEVIRRRADDQIGNERVTQLAETVVARLQEWQSLASVGQRNLVYRRVGKQDAAVPLLEEPGAAGWSRWTIPMSLRNVEAPVPLALRESGVSLPAEGWEAPEKAAPLPKERDT
jgi:hypothetical protein